jgi:hypothetical protein
VADEDAPVTAIPISIPSSTRCGCSAMIWRSLKVPGSDSSALQTAYFGCTFCFATNSHFVPVGKPAPPMPRSPDSFSLLTTSSPANALSSTARSNR